MFPDIHVQPHMALPDHWQRESNQLKPKLQNQKSMIFKPVLDVFPTEVKVSSGPNVKDPKAA